MDEPHTNHSRKGRCLNPSRFSVFDVVFARHKRRESQIETNPCSALTLHAWFHIPWFQKYSFLYSSNVCSHVGQSMHVDKQISFSITYLLPSKLQLFDPFFSGKYEKLFSSLYSLYSLITWKRQKATFCAHCVYSLAMFSSKERLERKLPN